MPTIYHGVLSSGKRLKIITNKPIPNVRVLYRGRLVPAHECVECHQMKFCGISVLGRVCGDCWRDELSAPAASRSQVELREAERLVSSAL